MKKVIIVLSMLFATSAMALDAYVGIHGEVSSEALPYTKTTDYDGVSMAIEHSVNDSVFVRFEAMAHEHEASPNLAVGYKSGKFRISGGRGQSQERSSYQFGNGFADGYSTDKYMYNFIDLEYSGFFARLSEFEVNNTYGSSKCTAGCATMTPTIVHTSATASKDRELIQVGYRHRF